MLIEKFNADKKKKVYLGDFTLVEMPLNQDKVYVLSQGDFQNNVPIKYSNK